MTTTHTDTDTDTGTETEAVVEAAGQPGGEPDAAELRRLAARRRTRERRTAWRARRVLVHGRLVAPIPEPWHGKAWVYDDYGCRCERCEEAKRAYGVRRHSTKRRPR
jgi:hypothetical protein